MPIPLSQYKTKEARRARWLELIEEVYRWLEEVGAELVVINAGADAHEKEYHIIINQDTAQEERGPGGLKTTDYQNFGHRLRGICRALNNVPAVFVTEGGYNIFGLPAGALPRTIFALVRVVA